MGTNYYWHRDPCPHCGRSDEELHIGKSSAGWEFSFQGYPTIRSWSDWKHLLQSEGMIKDGYGDAYTFEEFRQVVEEREHPRGLLNSTDEMRKHYPRSAVDHWKDDEGYAFSDREFS